MFSDLYCVVYGALQCHYYFNRVFLFDVFLFLVWPGRGLSATDQCYGANRLSHREAGSQCGAAGCSEGGGGSGELSSRDVEVSPCHCEHMGIVLSLVLEHLNQ